MVHHSGISEHLFESGGCFRRRDFFPAPAPPSPAQRERERPDGREPLETFPERDREKCRSPGSESRRWGFKLHYIRLNLVWKVAQRKICQEKVIPDKDTAMRCNRSWLELILKTIKMETGKELKTVPSGSSPRNTLKTIFQIQVLTYFNSSTL